MDTDGIIAKARAIAGLDDLGDPAARDGLDRLVAASVAEARLSDVGAQRWEANLVDTLVNRLRIVDYLKHHPEVLDAPVTRPMFVFGLPRTGTTLTINLLGADPARRTLMRWEALHSAPPAVPGGLRTDARYVAEQARLDRTIQYMPQIAAIHYEDADSPTECQYPMALSFCAQIFEATANVPGYRDWFLQADYLPAFRFHKQLLQLLQSTNGGRWTLKNPWHPLFLDALTTVYPDAELVMTHRDPVEVVGSACSLIRHVRPMFSDSVDLREIAGQVLDTFDHMIARQEAYRAVHGADAIHDIRYADQLRDPIGEMRRLYARFDEPFTDEAEAAMRRTLAANPKGKHGRHEYSLEEFGLTPQDVRDRFREYGARYGV